MPLIDEQGNKHGRLTVISRAENNSKKAFWNCECECGGKCVVLGTNLRTGHTKSCGCLSRELLDSRNQEKKGKPRPNRIKDISGQVCSDLTVLKMHKSEKGKTYWECQCKCGETTIVSKANLISDGVKSCGCRLNQKSKRRKDHIGEKFGILTVLERDEDNSKKLICECECGSNCSVYRTNLLQEITKSCGCRSRGGQKFGTIYKIVNCKDEVVYVGRTCKKNLEDRFKNHKAYTKNIRMKKLFDEDKNTKIAPILENVLLEYIDKLEKKFIKSYSKSFDLYNIQHNS